MTEDRLLPRRSPVHRLGRRLGAVPHGLPTAVTFSGAAAAMVAGSLFGLGAVLPAIGSLVLPGGHPGGPPDLPAGDKQVARTSMTPAPRTTPAPGRASRAFVATTGAGGSTSGPRGTAAPPTGPGPTHAPPRPAPATPSPSPAGWHDGDGDGEEHGRATPPPWPTASPWPTATPRPTRSPRPTPTPTPTPTARPWPTPAPTASPTPRPTQRPRETSRPRPTPSPTPTPTPRPRDD